MELIIYRKSDGRPLAQEGITSFYTQDTYDSTHIYEHIIEKFKGEKEDYSEIWLEDELIIQKTFTHEYTIQNDELVFGEEKTFEDAPQVPTPEERIKALEEERLYLQLALAESIEKQEIDKVNNQLALAELVETLTIKGVL
jgi:hypothetical protein